MIRNAKVGIFLILAAISSCGDIPINGSLATLNDEKVSGIYLTRYGQNPHGTFGNPSKGGDADGKTVKCSKGNGRGEFKMFHPAPNPADERSIHGLFKIGCRSDITITVTEASASEWLVSTSSSMAGIVSLRGRKVLEMQFLDLEPNYYNFDYINSYNNRDNITYSVPGYEFNGFYRVMITSPGIKAWRDIAVYEDPCLAPVAFGVRRHCI